MIIVVIYTIGFLLLFLFAGIVYLLFDRKRFYYEVEGEVVSTGIASTYERSVDIKTEKHGIRTYFCKHSFGPSPGDRVVIRIHRAADDQIVLWWKKKENKILGEER